MQAPPPVPAALEADCAPPPAVVLPAEARPPLPLDDDGCLPLPNGPGLGVQFDPELVDRYTVRN